MRKKTIVCGTLMVICFISAICFMGSAANNAEEKAAFEELKRQVRKQAELDHGPQAETGQELQAGRAEESQEELAGKEILLQYQELHEQNPDMAGWVAIEGTALSYPVMYTPDDVEYYLKRDFDKNESVAGTPFIGYDCTLNPRSDNVLLYGHHMKNGTMFTTLIFYKDKSFWEKHPRIQFDTLYETGEYEVMAAFYVTATVGNGHFEFYNFVDAGTEEEFLDFVNTCKEQSLYDTGVTAEYGDSLITLSTCSYHSENGRFVVVARKRSED